jgi:hypothetical protein
LGGFGVVQVLGSFVTHPHGFTPGGRRITKVERCADRPQLVCRTRLAASRCGDQ